MFKKTIRLNVGRTIKILLYIQTFYMYNFILIL